jgi:DNA-binding LytR/AlgR family response regulator
MKSIKNTDNGLIVHVGSRTYFNPSEIYLLESFSNYTQIYLKSGEVFLSSTTLKKIEERLSFFSSFKRVNRQTIVNFDYVRNMFPSHCELENNLNIIFSRRKSKLFFEQSA